MTYKNNNRKEERASMIGSVWIVIAILVLGIVVAELYRSGRLSNPVINTAEPQNAGSGAATR